MIFPTFLLLSFRIHSKVLLPYLNRQPVVAVVEEEGEEEEVAVVITFSVALLFNAEKKDMVLPSVVTIPSLFRYSKMRRSGRCDGFIF